MAIRNLNTIQNQNDLDFVHNSSKEYILQALANLGQRIGVQGDGVKINNFTFSNIVNGEKYDSSQYIGCISYKPSEALHPVKFSICTKEDCKDVPSTTISLSSPFNYIVTSDICKLTKTINGVDCYDTNGMIVSDDNFYTISFKGINEEVNRYETHEYICERINKFNNIVVSALRIRKVNNQLKLIIATQNTSNTYYTIKFYNIVGTITIDDLVNLINHISPDALCPEAIIATDDICTRLGSTCAIADYQPELVLTNVEYINETANFVFDESQAIGYDIPTIKTCLTYFTYDFTYLYRFVKHYYSEIVYNYDNSQLRRQIAANIAKMIFAYDNYSAKTNGSYKIYVPLDYSFNYACSTDNEWEIYYSTLDTPVKFVPDNQLLNIVAESDSSAFITKTANCERIAMFNYNIDYDAEDDSTIYGINAYKHYTLPYINGENYWVIDDVDSNIYAKGINAGNPNIILIKTHASTNAQSCVEPTILCSANGQLIDGLKWKYEEVVVKRIKSISINTETVGYSYVKMKYAVPDIVNSDPNKLDEYLHSLDNAIIMNMAGSDCVLYDAATLAEYQYTPEQMEEELGKDGVITTLWKLDTNDYDFKCVKLNADDTTVVDFNYITNFNNLINYALRHYDPKHPDKYHHDQVVFSRANVVFKNNERDEDYYVYPVLRNIESSEYNANTIANGISIGKYYNNLNFTIRYNDNIPTAEDNKINKTDIGQSTNRYFNTSYNDGVADRLAYVTNSFYTYTNSSKQTKYFEEYIPNYDVPSLDLGEVLTRNETLINRLNILSFNEYGKTFNSYIGTSYEYDKTKLVIGTSETNINMGADTLIENNKRNTFNKQTELHFDFPNTFVSGYAYVANDLIVYGDTISYGINWIKKPNKFNGVTYWSTQILPTGRYIYELEDIYIDDSKTYGSEEVEYTYCGCIKLSNKVATNHHSYMTYIATSKFAEYAIKNDKIFAIPSIREDYSDGSSSNGYYDIYLGDAIYIPSLLHKLHLSDRINTTNELVSFNNVEITTNMNLYSYIVTTTTHYDYDYDGDGNGGDNITTVTKYPLLLQSTALNLTDNNLYEYTINYDEEATSFYQTKIHDFTYGEFKVNELDITYYVDSNVLHLNIIESSADNIMQYAENLQLDYEY